MEVDWEGVRDTEGVTVGDKDVEVEAVVSAVRMLLDVRLGVAVEERECMLMVAGMERDTLDVVEKDSLGLPLWEGLVEVLKVRMGVRVLDLVPRLLME